MATTMAQLEAMPIHEVEALIAERDAAVLCRVCGDEPRFYRDGWGIRCRAIESAEQERQRILAQREADRAALARRKSEAAEAGFVVGARVQRKAGGSVGTIESIVGDHARVVWHNATRRFNGNRDMRSRIKWTTLKTA